MPLAHFDPTRPMLSFVGLAVLSAVLLWTVALMNLSRITKATNRKKGDLLIALGIVALGGWTGWRYAFGQSMFDLLAWFVVFGLPVLVSGIGVLQWIRLPKSPPNE